MDKKQILDKLKYVLIFSLATISLEIVAFWSLNFGFLPKYFLFDFSYILIISGVLFLMNNRTNKIILITTLLSIQLILNCVNASYNSVLGDVFSFDLLKIIGEATKVFKLSFINFKALILNALTFTVFILILFSTTKNEVKIDKSTKTYKAKRLSAFSLVTAIFLLFSSFGLSTNVLSYSLLTDLDDTDAYYVAKSDLYLYDNFQFKMEAYKKFGTFGFYIKSLENLVSKNEISSEEKQELISYLNEGKVEKNNSAQLKDKNLVVIMLESFDWFAIDPYTTPTLYDLVTNKGQVFTNFRAYNKTNMSEDIAILGNFPKKTDVQALARDKDFAPINSLAYKFKDEGYIANYFHSFDINFYTRNVVNKKFGFDNLYGLQSSGLGSDATLGRANLEEDFLNSCITNFAPKGNKFFSFYTTVGTHGPYTKLNERYKDNFDFYEENFTKIASYLTNQGYKIPTNKKYYNMLKEFKCAAMDTDKMISNLINYLEENNLMETTSIMLFADHNCYYDDLNLITRFGKTDYVITSSDIYNIPFIIYDKTLGYKKIDTFCSTYDIYPTICELFGLEYNKNFTQGYNVYNEKIKDTVFASNLTGIFTDKYYSLNILEVWSNGEENEEELVNFQKNAVKFYDKQGKIDKIYMNKLYNRP